MAFHIVSTIALLFLSPAWFSNAAMQPSRDLRGKVRKAFTIHEADGWFLWEEKEIAYKVIVQRATWDEAEAICKQRNAHLASVLSVEENDVIYGKRQFDAANATYAYYRSAR
ncbi:hypothetical protein COOONC_06974, partial [Cooperia oncophora]